MTAQLGAQHRTAAAGAARLLLDTAPERAREPIAAVEDTGRETLAELRRLLGLLHPPSGDHGTLDPTNPPQTQVTAHYATNALRLEITDDPRTTVAADDDVDARVPIRSRP